MEMCRLVQVQEKATEIILSSVFVQSLKNGRCTFSSQSLLLSVRMIRAERYAASMRNLKFA